MSLEYFRGRNFNSEALVRIAQCNKIIRSYMNQGLRLTLRQLYYQLVSANVIPNVERSYKNLSTLVSDARLAGLMDWDAIEDRVRQPKAAGEYKDLAHLADTAIKAYRLPRWKGQDYYVELWCEKDALAGVLWPLAHEFHITMMVNRGYSSQSAMYESAKRIAARAVAPTLPFILYLGDHDPSGEDMVRDINHRLLMFNVIVHVKKIALTREQIREYNPPPNPAKITDPRAREYIAKHGDSSWEVDALPPAVLQTIIRDELDEYVDVDLMKKVTDQEDKDKKRLRKAVASLMKGP